MSAPRAAPGFSTFGFFVARSPLLPAETLEAIAAGDAALATLGRDPLVQLAVELASPGLAAELDGRDRPSAEAAAALRRYLLRASFRPTPFGLFAGYSIGRLGEATRLSLPPRAAYQRRTELDLRLLDRLGAQLAADPRHRDRLPLRANPTLVRFGDRLHYTALDQATGITARCYLVVDQALAATLAAAAEQRTFAALRRRLVRAGAPAEAATAYLLDLVRRGALIVDLGPALVGPSPTAAMRDRVAALGAGDEARALDEARAGLEVADRGPVDARPYRAVRMALERSVAGDGRALQADVCKPADLALPRRVSDELLAGVRMLHRICGHEPDPMLEFRAAFAERYGEAEVPLLEALDEQLGIGYLSPSSSSLPTSSLVAQLSAGAPRALPFGERERKLRALVDLALERGGPLELDAVALAALSGPRPPRPRRASYAVVTIAARDAAAVDRGEFRLCLQSVGGPSAVNLLARPAARDPELAALIAACARAERVATLDADVVEVVHLPARDTANVLWRARLHEHELVLFGRGAEPAARRRLALGDLLVTVRDEEVILRSRRTGRRVVPRTSSAHHPGDGAMVVHRFLADLQYQLGVDAVRWRWGALAGAARLPRVTCGRLVLSLASWRVDGPLDLEALRRRGVPRWVTLADEEGSPTLPLDLAAASGRDELARDLWRRGGVEVLELFPTVDDMPLVGPEGRYASELIVPLAHTPEASPPMTSAAPEPRRPARATPPGRARIAPPGSDWLYAKLYTGAALVDDLLLELGRLVERARREGGLRRWFFVRFADPSPHLRLRLHGRPAALLRVVLPRLHAWARPHLEARRLVSLQLDTYRREIERYGGPRAIGVAESLFEVDSELVLHALARGLAPAAEARLPVSLHVLEQTLAGLGLSLAERLRVVRQRREALAAQLGLPERGARALGDHYRSEHERLAQALRAGARLEPPTITRRRRRLLALLAGRTRTPSRESLALDLLHMHALRLYPSAALASELLVFDQAARLYAAELARGR